MAGRVDEGDMGLLEAVSDGAKKLLTKYLGEKPHAVEAQAETLAELVSGSYWMGSSAFPGLGKALRSDQRVLPRYSDYEDMKDDPILGAGLKIYADEATSKDPRFDNKAIHVKSENQKHVDMALEGLDHGGIEDGLWDYAHGMSQYGVWYEEMEVADKEGLVGTHTLPPAITTRVEDGKGSLLGYYYGLRANQETPRRIREAWQELYNLGGGPAVDGSVAFDYWEVMCFRHQAKGWAKNGVSVLEPARHPWKRLMLAEQASLMHKLTRATPRDVFYVEMGTAHQGMAELAELNRVRAQHKKRSYIDPSSGEVSSLYSPLAVPDDFYVPMRNGKKSIEIDTHEPRDWQSLELLEHFQNRVLAGIMMPKAWLSFTEDMQSRATLTSQDIRFARTIIRLQGELLVPVRFALSVHFAAKGIDPETVKLVVSLTPNSSIFELVQMEVEKERAGLARDMSEMVSLFWIQRHIFGWSEEEIKEDWKRKNEEAKLRSGVMQAEGGDEGEGGGRNWR